ncbi:hypothetical protein K470DRAFT_258434 [Piedraia hortae CBS 480.64]|uniref:Uncharacterized protein n=1 Tax=Piedraia hortae CBS 480.64 TaxID=1314780 RepID=A0A6A7BXG9_9PEZI|nr:hypothetical protein K470DRAFT_258434 [Piedraia hortae CBS 480.64]
MPVSFIQASWLVHPGAITWLFALIIKPWFSIAKTFISCEKLGSKDAINFRIASIVQSI